MSDFSTWLLCLLPTVFCLLLLYWELIVAEGAHLGPRVVALLYDRVAHRYDKQIKNFDPATEDDLLGLPLIAELIETDAPRVLDVACGTGRVSRALLRQTAFDGVVINVDLAERMMKIGREAAPHWPGRVHWLRSPADQLSFPDNTFDCVTCLEALEFFPDARAALAACVRVLKPGGLLVVTNRVGWEAPLILGKTFSRPAFTQLLTEFPLIVLRVHPWLVDYDLAWARKRRPGD
jgi:ubiquinone/menaquinone biosynthesis C-methylase UbiE